MDISKRLKEIRESKGLKQHEIASKLGIEQAGYAYFEKRGKNLTLAQIENIATALGISLKELFFDEKGENYESELEKLQREFEIKRLRMENEMLKRENQLLEKEMELLKSKYNA